MDSPVIVDTASKFGRGIDLDRSFPGFPFDDDDDFGRRSDIRAHLDDLAARHPEFADHLLGPPWGDVPFRGSTHNQRRGSGNGGSSYQGYPDEDARSQASGSSAASAASGASGVSSHGEPDTVHQDQQDRQSQRETKRNPIPQYGLRNTVDIGQHHRHNMENPEKESRGQRSMSAPPENRQQTNSQQTSQEQDKPQPGQRFVSRVDITPQHNQQSSQQQPKQQPQQTPPQQQSQSNVRHIPIFVEGRDEPVIPKNIDASFQKQQSPPQFHTTPPHFQKSTPFNQRFSTRQWPPHFQDSFYQPNSTFDHSPTRRTQQTYQQPRQQQYAEKQRPEQQQQKHHFEAQPQEHLSRQRPQTQQQQKQKPQQQHQHQHQQQQQQQQPQQEAPKPAPKPTLPKDPLERVALVQKEVDSLAEQVKLYTGNSRKDKQYMYLDEMLTRELIKLDDIETEGRENVRQARKNAIRTIQETICFLESKAPLPGQERPKEESQAMQVDQSQDNNEQEKQPLNEAMDVDQNTEQNAQANEAIPLPPAPSSPTKQAVENNEAAPIAQEEQQNAPTVDQPAKQEQENQPIQSQEQQQQGQEQQPQQEQQQDQQQEDAAMVDGVSNENTNSNEATMQDDTSTPMEVQEKVKSTVEEKKDENQNVSQEIKTENADENPAKEQKETESKEKAKTDKGSTQSPKTIKKAKKQAAPISKEPIPLPPPQSTETSAK
ncbi:hypothetical protein KPH14_003134 [Odynerus spinipes]|uniref:BAG domain-containing protein n=1 Tax=Odynerus spinipes TaxID=1348599 RepID=A0AAD9VVG0_9HYME|nr:hypothetical protein KPH14_003134 [Odynerus spinipes]